MDFFGGKFFWKNPNYEISDIRAPLYKKITFVASIAKSLELDDDTLQTSNVQYFTFAHSNILTTVIGGKVFAKMLLNVLNLFWLKITPNILKRGNVKKRSK